MNRVWVMGWAVLLVSGVAMGSAGAGDRDEAFPLDFSSDYGVVHDRLEFIKDEGLRTQERVREKMERKLQKTARQVDRVARRIGDQGMAERLGAEFAVAPEALLAQKADIGASWAEMLIGYTLGANARTAVTPDQLVAIEHQGMGWGQIAAGLGFGLHQTVAAARTEGRVAQGKVRPDGKVASISISDQVAAEGPVSGSNPAQ